MYYNYYLSHYYKYYTTYKYAIYNIIYVTTNDHITQISLNQKC